MLVRRLAFAVLLPAALAAAPARADAPAIAVRSGNHPGFGRIVLDLPAGVTATVAQDGNHARVQLAGAGAITFGPLPHNVLAMESVADGAVISLGEGVRLRQSRLGGKLVLDLLDTASGPSTPAAAPRPAAARRTAIVHGPGPDSIARQREAIAGPAATPAQAVIPPVADIA